MPELPEVETTCRGIAPFAEDQVIESIVIRQPKLRWPVDLKLNDILMGQTITIVKRRAKYCCLETKIGSLMIHLGMSGSLKIVDGQLDVKEPIKKHDHVDICLSNQKIIRFNDPRRFGSIIFNQQSAEHPLLKKLGPEPLTDSFNSDYLHSKAVGRKVSIKAFIMNNHIVVGVGNIYAQESLFLSGIHPNRAANKISLVRMKMLVTTIKEVLAKAIKAGGSSLKDFTGADGKPGYFQQTLSVYGRQGESCVSCQTNLKHCNIGQRATVYCPSCQR
jgi:formamidopyrimidine-DNA glycosylase